MNDRPQSKADATKWLDEHGDVLYGFALARVRDASVAEDLVQETLLAGVRAADQFDGRAQERTWLVGILKHKIADYFRQSRREQSLTDDEADLSSYEYLFPNGGHWNAETKPVDWGASPAADVEKAEFRKILQHCLGELPERVANCFVLREMEGLSGSEVSAILGISASNFWVMMHRARLHLRRCVEFGWYRR